MRVLRQTVRLGLNGILLSDPYRILHVAAVASTAQEVDVWFVSSSDDDASVATRPFDVLVAGTGDDMSGAWTPDHYVGTCVMPSGFAWHVFARPA